MRRYSICTLVFVGLVLQTPDVRAQETPTPAQAEEQSEQSQPQTVLTAPDYVSGSNQQLFSEALENRDIIAGRLGLSGLFDDNAFSAGSHRLATYQYSILPGIRLDLFRPHTQFELDYAGGITFDQRIRSRDMVTHDFEAQLQRNLSRRLLIELREDYLISNNPFVRPGQSRSLPSLAGPGQLTPFISTGTADRIANISSGDLTYQLTERSSLGVSGTFSSQRFKNVGSVTSVGLIDTKTVAGRLFFVHQLRPNQKVGAQYLFQDLRFARGQSRTVDHTLFLFDEVALKSNMALTLFVGPQHSHIHGVLTFSPIFSTHVLPIVSDGWSPAAGATYSWRGSHTAVRVSGLRSISDGGGLLGATLANSVSVEVEEEFTRQWRASLGTSYFNGRSIDGSNANAAGKLTSEQAHFSLVHWIMNDLSAELRYSYVQQRQVGGVAINRSVFHGNQIEIGISYRIARALSQ